MLYAHCKCIDFVLWFDACWDSCVCCAQAADAEITDLSNVRILYFDGFHDSFDSAAGQGAL